MKRSTELASAIITAQSARDALCKVAKGKTNTSVNRLDVATRNALIGYEQQLIELQSKLGQAFEIGDIPLEKLDRFFTR